MDRARRPNVSQITPGALRSAGAVAALAYAGTVALVEAARPAGLGSGDLASSPARLAAGHVWELLTSGLVTTGHPVLQLVAVAPVAALAIAWLGPLAFWRAALAGHVGATLVVYAGVGLLWLLSPADVDPVVRAPDYGISCVWAGALGALVAGSLRLSPALWVVILAGVACVTWLPFWGELAGVEHVVAFALGALVTARAGCRAPRLRRDPGRAIPGVR